VLDPFAGGSVRGIVASRLGYRYVGIELRQEQVEANRRAIMLSSTAKGRQDAVHASNQPPPAQHQGGSLFGCKS